MPTRQPNSQQQHPEPKRRRVSARIAPKISPALNDPPVDTPARAQQLDTREKPAALHATPDRRSRSAFGWASDSSGLQGPVTPDAPPAGAAPSRFCDQPSQPSGSVRVASRNAHTPNSSRGGASGSVMVAAHDTHTPSSGGRAAKAADVPKVPKAAGDEWGPLTAKLAAALEHFIDNRSLTSFQQWHQ